MPTRDEIQEVCKLEHTALRRELNQLKWCQIQFFTFAISATIVILGLIFRGFEDLNINLFETNSSCLICLIPLLFLIPSLWIFLDKAKTISRIIGYHYWLEDILLGSLSPEQINFFGWENALMIFRDHWRVLEREKEGSPVNETIGNLLRELDTYNRKFYQLRESNFAVLGSIRGYLVAGYLTFVAFMLLCSFPFSYFVYTHGPAVLFANIPFNLLGSVIVAFTLFVVVYEFATLKHLIYGKFSDKANKIKWRIAFDKIK